MKKKKSFLQKAVSAVTAFAVMLTMGFALPKQDTVKAATTISVTGEEIASHFLGYVGQDYYVNMCLAFVAHGFEDMGATFSSKCCAWNYSNTYLDSTSRDIPIGADVFFSSTGCAYNVTDSNGHDCGHIGVYVGDGYMVHAYSGEIVKMKISKVESHGYTYLGWGVHGNVKIVDAATLSSISVTTAPNTTIYEDGSTFSTAGMVVTAKYSDGSSKAVTGYTTSADLSTAGTKNVTISYTEGGVTKTATQSVTVQDLFAGSGTASDPYQIGTAGDLQAVADNVNHISANGCYGYAYYIQTADIDLNGIDWIPIGIAYDDETTTGYKRVFQGHYNGNYHKVTNLYVNYDRQWAGLFGKIHNSSVVENLSVSGSVYNTDIMAGGIAGEATYGSIVRNCDFTGTVEAPDCAGSITGSIWAGSTISNCYANATITAYGDTQRAGGITGRVMTGNAASSVDILVENCYFTGTVIGAQNGGICGYTYIYDTYPKTITFTNNYYLNSAASGAVAGAAQTGCSALSSTLLKESAEMLGAVYTSAAEGQNDGYPVFVWQNAPFAGSGTESDPYQISSKEELEKMRDLVNDTSVNPIFGTAYYIQTADIDLENENWVPIGLGYEGDDGQGTYNYTTRMFYGVYDGNQHNIYNLNVDGSWKVGGLFAFVRSGPVRQASATVKDLVVYGSVNTAGQSGGIVGQVQWGGTIENCAFIGDVTGVGCAGGIAACAWAGDTITSCYHMGNVTSEGNSGGVVGAVDFGADNVNGDTSNITNCYHAGGNVTGTSYSGGIIGSVLHPDGVSTIITVDNCYFLSGTATNTTNPDATADNTLALTESLMKKIAGDLGAPYADNTNPALNDGFPVFEWQLIVKGDANTDGTVSVPDIAALQKHILTISALNSEQCENADMNADGVVDAFDLAILKAVLLRK